MDKRPFLPALFGSLLINTFFQKPAVGADFLGVFGGSGGRSSQKILKHQGYPLRKYRESVRRGVSLVLSPDMDFPIVISLLIGISL